MTADNVYALADALEEKQRRDAAPPPPIDEDRPKIRVVPGERPRIVDEAEQALLKRFPEEPIYRFGSRLVRVSWDVVRVLSGGNTLALRHAPVNAANLAERMMRAAYFMKHSKQAKADVVIDCPDEVANAYLSRGDWKLPPLLGVITAPTLRPDGSILDAPGYDWDTGIVFNPLGVAFPKVPLDPTADQARAALELLKKPIRLYRFEDPALDRAVSLSAILTALVRPAMGVAPLHAFDAPTAGSGKSNLVDVASAIATGHRAAVTSACEDTGEFEKRLEAAVLSGDRMVAIDNVDKPLNSPFLNQLLTQEIVKIRLFHTQDKVPFPSTAMYTVTGNNIVLAGDLTRRSLVARIDPGTERPELERYPFNPPALALRARPRLVAAALTVMRAYHVSGERVAVDSPIGSYAEWSRFVREPLIWLGEEDPVRAMERTRGIDPQLSNLRDVMIGWIAVLGITGRELFTRDIVAAAVGQQDIRPDFYAALRAVAPGRGSKEEISGERLGWWFRHNLGRAVRVAPEGRDDEISVRIIAGKGTTQGARWRLEPTKKDPHLYIPPADADRLAEIGFDPPRRNLMDPPF